MDRSSPRTVSTPAALILIILLGLAAFGRVAKFEFTTWDDDATIVHNPKLNPPTPASMKSFWTQPQGDLYIPVTYMVWAFAADTARAQPPSHLPPTVPPQIADASPPLEPRVFHTLNLAFHLLSACIAFLLLRELIGADIPALAGGLLFLLHPVQVESVAWVSGMKDLLFGLLSLVAIWQYVRLAREDAAGADIPASEWWGKYAIATAAFVLAMLSKPTAIVVPTIVIVLDVLVIARPEKKALMWTWPWLVLALPCILLARWAQPTNDLAVAAWNTPLRARPLVAADALAFYLYKLAWPATLSFDYGRTPQRVVALGWLGFTWVAPLLVLILLVALSKRAKPLVAGGVIALIALSPMLGLVPFEFQAYSTVADHYLYLALLGPALAVAWVLSRRQNAVTIALTGVVLIVLGIRTFNQTQHWRNSTALFDHARQVNPSSFASFNSLAASAIDARQFPDAVAYANIAVQINPSFFPARLTRAGALAALGDLDGAIADCRKALDLSPEHPEALANLAALLARQGHFAEALDNARRAVAKNKDSLPMHLLLANLLAASRDDESAVRELQWILERDPDHVPARELMTQLRPPAPTTP